MPELKVDLEAEQAAFEADVAAIEKQWSSPKQAHLKRPYTAKTIAALRNTVSQTYFSSTQAVKLWSQLNEHAANGTCELTFGTTDPVAASQMAKHCQTVYVSGALCGLSEVSTPGMDHADYPWDTVPKVVKKITSSQLWHDQRQRQYRFRHQLADRAALEGPWDYLAPVVADGDMGFGSLTATMKMAKEFVESGVAMVHVDDLALGMKKFTVGQGRTVVPTSEYLDRLSAVRMQFDVMGAETLLLCRCDTDHSEFITSVVDPRDHEYVQGATKPVEPLETALAAALEQGKDLKQTRTEWKERAGIATFDDAVKAVASEEEYAAYTAEVLAKTTPLSARREASARVLKKDVFFDWELPRSRMGQYMFKSCIKAVVERALTAAPLGDLTWARMDSPVWNDIVEFHTAVRKVHPNRLFAFGYTGDYNFATAGFSEDQVKSFHFDLAKLGVVWQVQPIWSLQGLNMVTEEFAKLWAEEGIAGYMRAVQNPAQRRIPIADGFEKLSYCGGYLADAFFETVAGETITDKPAASNKKRH